MEKLFEAMDFVTSDEYLRLTGNEYFWQKHAKIITKHFDGDWCWDDAIKYWTKKDQKQAVEIRKDYILVDGEYRKRKEMTFEELIASLSFMKD